ncbi:MAG: amino acid adenylation domain-containing protein, partial [Acidobacteria bacterium]|nr:amino acid adenylation domain-containing protein [Acidobacteriota bacterium]
MTTGPISGCESGKNVFPLSQGQRGLWFLHQLHPRSAAYNIARAASIRQALDVDAYRRAWQAVIDRHATLRTTFLNTSSGPMQVVHPQQEVCFQLEDASAWSTEQLDERLAEETYRPFDLEQGPLLRIRLFRQNEDNILGLLLLHHIVCDLWSLNILLLESSHLYHAMTTAAPLALRPLRADYAGFVRSQAEMLAGPEGERLWTYWRDRLQGELPALNMPTDRPRPVLPTDRASCVSREFPMELADALNRLAKAHDTNAHTVMLTAFQVLLHRYTGQTDVIVGSPYAGRSAALASVVGYMVNTLVFRARFSHDQTFADALAQARRTVSDDLAHGAYPFPLLVERLQPERDLSLAPLFQVMFAWQKTSRLVDWDALAALNSGRAGERFELAGMSFETVSFRPRTSPFDLTLHVIETSRGFSLSLEYNTALFDETTARRLILCYETLLEAVAAEPHRRISELPLIAEAERGQVLVEWNRTQAGYPRDLCVHHLFETQAKRTPDAVAVSFGKQTLTYAELNRRANQLAHHIRSLGIAPGAPFGLCTERSLEMAVGVLGILKAAGAYVPLDPAYPPARLAQMLSDAQSPVVLTQRSLLGKLSEHSAHVICLDADWPRIAASPAADPEGAATPETAAYVLYTSGSTGRPKGVVMGHRALVNLITWQTQASTPGSARTLQFASLSFDVSFQEIFSTWCSGGTLVLIADDVRRDSKALLHFLGNEGIERLFVPFVILQQLAEAYEHGGPPPACLRDVITAGEALRITPQIVRLFKALPHCALHNQYGPTESHVATAYKLQGAPDEWPALPPVGRPIANAHLLILDRNRQPVPVGVPGELYIGGTGLAHGYLNRPELTAERFVEIDRSLVPSLPSSRFYETGDLARYLADGNVEFLGRTDEQVRFAAFASNRARSRRCWPSTPACARPWYQYTNSRAATGNWLPTSFRRCRTPEPCAGSSPPACRITWSPPPSSGWQPFRSPPAASWIAGHSPPLRRLPPKCRPPRPLRAPPSKKSWRGSGRTCWGARVSASTMTSLNWAVTPCSRPRFSRGCA